MFIVINVATFAFPKQLLYDDKNNVIASVRARAVKIQGETVRR